MSSGAQRSWHDFDPSIASWLTLKFAEKMFSKAYTFCLYGQRCFEQGSSVLRKFVKIIFESIYRKHTHFAYTRFVGIVENVAVQVGSGAVRV
jgi:hypothetical protein